MQFDIKEEGGFQYVENGNGPTLLVLHGLFGALSNFQEGLPFLGVPSPDPILAHL